MLVCMHYYSFANLPAPVFTLNTQYDSLSKFFTMDIQSFSTYMYSIMKVDWAADQFFIW